MKKGFLMTMVAVVALVLVSAPAKAVDEEYAAKSQLHLTIDKFFWETENVSGYAWGSALINWNVNEMPTMIVEVGPVIHLTDKINLYILTASMHEPIGWSFGGSGQLEYSGEKNHLLAVYEHYEPVMPAEHEEERVLMPFIPELPEQSYYWYGQYDYSLIDDVKVGAFFESFGYYEDDDPVTCYYGVFAQYGKLQVMVGPEEMPMEPNKRWLLFRGKIAI